MRLVRVRYTLEARRDLSHIYDYIAERNPQAASRVIRRIVAAIDLLSEFPRISHVGRAPDTREWVVKGLPYVIGAQDRDCSRRI